MSVAWCWDAHKALIDKFSSIHLIKRKLKFHLVQGLFLIKYRFSKAKLFVWFVALGDCGPLSYLPVLIYI